MFADGSAAPAERADAGFEWLAAAAAEVGAQLRDLPPGAELAGVLEWVQPARLPLGERVDAVVAWERLGAWVAAGQAAALAALDAPADAADPAARARAVDGDDWMREEVACALRLSPTAAGNRLHVARELAGRLTDAHASLAAGAISYRKAADLALEVSSLSDSVAAAVEAKVLRRAPMQTPAAFRQAVRRAIAAADPVEARQRHVRARAERCVRMTPLPDGMAEIWALLPAEGATTVFSALTRHATRDGSHVSHPECHDPLDARRADALVELCAGYLAAPGASGAHPTVAVQVVASLSTLLAISDDPAELAGYGPITAQVARALAADGDWRRLITDEGGRLLDYGRTTYRPPAALADYLRARDRTCCFPGCAMPATRCDLDHGVPYDEGGTTSASNMGPLCRRHHRAKHEAGWKLERDDDGSCTWTSPAGKVYRTFPPHYP